MSDHSPSEIERAMANLFAGILIGIAQVIKTTFMSIFNFLVKLAS